MVAEDFLRDPQVRQWLSGAEPVWTLLTLDSLRALRQEPSAVQTAIRIANDLNTEEIAGSPMARNTLILLRQAIERDGLPVTATGNLSCLSHKPRWTPSPNASSSEPGVIVRSFLETGVTVRAPYSCSSVCQFEGTAPTGPGAG